MSVYVDESIWPFRNMIMCHMMADSTEELLEMADKIGVQSKWIQNAGTPEEHFDIAKTKRNYAVKFGAIEVSSRDLFLLMDRRKNNPRFAHFKFDNKELEK